ncbi:MAG: hypothetical protein QM796_18715 [Chthoniobacteraceae bacterium]
MSPHCIPIGPTPGGCAICRKTGAYTHRDTDLARISRHGLVCRDCLPAVQTAEHVLLGTRGIAHPVHDTPNR